MGANVSVDLTQFVAGDSILRGLIGELRWRLRAAPGLVGAILARPGSQPILINMQVPWLPDGPSSVSVLITSKTEGPSNGRNS